MGRRLRKNPPSATSTKRTEAREPRVSNSFSSLVDQKLDVLQSCELLTLGAFPNSEETVYKYYHVGIYQKTILQINNFQIPLFSILTLITYLEYYSLSSLYCFSMLMISLLPILSNSINTVTETPTQKFLLCGLITLSEIFTATHFNDAYAFVVTFFLPSLVVRLATVFHWSSFIQVNLVEMLIVNFSLPEGDYTYVLDSNGNSQLGFKTAATFSFLLGTLIFASLQVGLRADWEKKYRYRNARTMLTDVLESLPEKLQVLTNSDGRVLFPQRKTEGLSTAVRTRRGRVPGKRQVASRGKASVKTFLEELTEESRKDFKSLLQKGGLTEAEDNSVDKLLVFEDGISRSCRFESLDWRGSPSTAIFYSSTTLDNLKREVFSKELKSLTGQVVCSIEYLNGKAEKEKDPTENIDAKKENMKDWMISCIRKSNLLLNHLNSLGACFKILIDTPLPQEREPIDVLDVITSIVDIAYDSQREQAHSVVFTWEENIRTTALRGNLFLIKQILYPFIISILGLNKRHDIALECSIRSLLPDNVGYLIGVNAQLNVDHAADLDQLRDVFDGNKGLLSNFEFFRHIIHQYGFGFALMAVLLRKYEGDFYVQSKPKESTNTPRDKTIHMMVRFPLFIPEGGSLSRTIRRSTLDIPEAIPGADLLHTPKQKQRRRNRPRVEWHPQRQERVPDYKEKYAEIIDRKGIAGSIGEVSIKSDKEMKEFLKERYHQSTTPKMTSDGNLRGLYERAKGMQPPLDKYLGSLPVSTSSSASWTRTENLKQVPELSGIPNNNNNEGTTPELSASFMDRLQEIKKSRERAKSEISEASSHNGGHEMKAATTSIVFPVPEGKEEEGHEQTRSESGPFAVKDSGERSLQGKTESSEMNLHSDDDDASRAETVVTGSQNVVKSPSTSLERLGSMAKTHTKGQLPVIFSARETEKWDDNYDTMAIDPDDLDEKIPSTLGTDPNDSFEAGDHRSSGVSVPNIPVVEMCQVLTSAGTSRRDSPLGTSFSHDDSMGSKSRLSTSFFVGGEKAFPAKRLFETTTNSLGTRVYRQSLTPDFSDTERDPHLSTMGSGAGDDESFSDCEIGEFTRSLRLVSDHDDGVADSAYHLGSPTRKLQDHAFQVGAGTRDVFTFKGSCTPDSRELRQEDPVVNLKAKETSDQKTQHAQQKQQHHHQSQQQKKKTVQDGVETVKRVLRGLE